MATKVQIEIKPVWSVIGEVREKIQKGMEGYETKYIDSAVMTASELLENAIKYGVSNDQISNVSLNFEIDKNFVKISLKNGIGDNTKIENFIKTMSKIEKSENKKNLYLERLQEIMNDPSLEGSELGLFRIVSEGGFDVQYRIDDFSLEIMAKKKLEQKNDSN